MALDHALSGLVLQRGKRNDEQGSLGHERHEGVLIPRESVGDGRDKGLVHGAPLTFHERGKAACGIAGQLRRHLTAVEGDRG